ncbi:MAG TPA: threonine/serine dehydratase [Nitrososphaerales archaeon]|nr:threonine/serine dehydratase [Nitrososphaerales archaeon]
MPIQSVTLEDVEEARKSIRGKVVRTPLVRLNAESAAEIYLKLECLQPTGSFKVRGSGNAISHLTSDEKAKGVYTCSAGNMAQALAWHAKREGVRCTVIVPDSAPQTKIDAIRRYGADIIQMTWDEVWEVANKRYYSPLGQRTFVHPFADPLMIAGNGTAGLEIVEDLPDVDAVVVPFGGGGLFTGIATAVKAKRASTSMYASEVETASPLSKSLAAGRAVEISRTPSFVDGIGGANVAEDMWERVRPLLSGSIVVSLREVASAVRLLMERNRVVSEGAGGTSVAAALTGKAGSGKVVCVVSGGNIDGSKLIKILQGETPN